MVLVGIDRRLPPKVLRRFIRQSFLQSVEWATHFGTLIPQIEKERFVEFSVSGEKALCSLQGALIVPPQAGTGPDIRLIHIGSGNKEVDRQQPAERMSKENLIGRNA